MKLPLAVTALPLLGAAHAQSIPLSIPLECGRVTNTDATDYAITENFTTLACHSAGGVLGQWNHAEEGHPMPCCQTPESGNGTFHSVCKALHGSTHWWMGPPRGEDDHCIISPSNTTASTPEPAVHAQNIPLRIPLACGRVTSTDATDYAVTENFTTLACHSAGGNLGKWTLRGRESDVPCCSIPEYSNDTFHDICRALRGSTHWWRGPPRGEDDHCITQSNTTEFIPERAVDALRQIIPLECGVKTPTGHYDVRKMMEITVPACRAAGGVFRRSDRGPYRRRIPYCKAKAYEKETFYSACEAAGKEAGYRAWPRQLNDTYEYFPV